MNTMEQGETRWAKHINNGAGRNTVGKTHKQWSRAKHGGQNAVHPKFSIS